MLMVWYPLNCFLLGVRPLESLSASPAVRTDFCTWAASKSGPASPSESQQRGSTSRSTAEPLPPYPALSPPPAEGSSYGDSSKKRRRHSSGAGMEAEHARVLRRLVNEKFSEMGKKMHAINDNLQKTKQELRDTQQELKGTTGELRETKQELQEAKQELHTKILDDLPEVRHSCIQYVDKSIEDAKEELDDRITEILNETDTHIDFQVDEELTGAKIELQDFVTDRLRSTTSEIVQRLRDARFTWIYDSTALEGDYPETMF